MSRPKIHASDKPVIVTSNGRTRQYANLAVAVLHHNILRDKSGKDASKWSTWTVECEGERYHISYNGLVWQGRPRDWSPETVQVIVPEIVTRV